MTADLALAPEERRLVARHWALRAAAEAGAAGAFEIVARDLAALGARDDLIEAATRAVGEERVHARLCREVAAAYDLASATAAEEAEEAHDLTERHGADRTSWLRHAIGFCCVSETFATAYLASSFAGTRAPRPREALRAMLADEIGHGRLGWALLASRVALAAEVEALLVPLLAAYAGYLRGRAADYPDLDLPAHGCPHPGAMVPHFLSAVDELILPGFERLGVTTAAARDWLREERR